MRSDKSNLSTTTIDIIEIKRLIPHRYPFLFVDSVTAFEIGKSAEGLKNVTINEPFFQGHFPVEPIMPGVLIIESFCYSCPKSKKCLEISRRSLCR